jgi:predicted 3-demethylubiquinone-9 3-methyltransferase (glyoxalase superfamily)
MQKITPNLWYDTQVEEAANFYVSIFKNSKLGKITRYGKEGFEVHGMPEGTVMTVEFELDGQQFLGLNGGPHFKFNEAISFIIDCDGQEEVDYFWNKFTENGGEPGPCGWIKDQFGLSWQVVPRILNELLESSDKAKAGRAMKAMLQMKKIIVADLEAAAEGK